MTPCPAARRRDLSRPCPKDVPALDSGFVTLALVSADARATEIESVVTEAWRDVLGVSRIEPGDSFVALGGHSLLALDVVAALERRLGVSLSVRELLEAPTLDAVVERIRRGAG